MLMRRKTSVHFKERRREAEVFGSLKNRRQKNKTAVGG